MAVFDENKVINALHKDKAEVGKRYWVSDSILFLKEYVRLGEIETTSILEKFCDDDSYLHVFVDDSNVSWEYLYPYEGQPKSKNRMTNAQLLEWLSKGFGMMKYRGGDGFCYISLSTLKKGLSEECAEDILIHSWDSDEWIEPTVDIYERDCKGDE